MLDLAGGKASWKVLDQRHLCAPTLALGWMGLDLEGPPPSDFCPNLLPSPCSFKTFRLGLGLGGGDSWELPNLQTAFSSDRIKFPSGA